MRTGLWRAELLRRQARARHSIGMSDLQMRSLGPKLLLRHALVLEAPLPESDRMADVPRLAAVTKRSFADKCVTQQELSDEGCSPAGKAAALSFRCLAARVSACFPS